ncbi:MAG: polysaccharide pyruvyl transferase family protein [Bacteroidota bacterium]|nr:polysaccharide pyruvyl transferase family protein [Bacteroidota bacterium]
MKKVILIIYFLVGFAGLTNAQNKTKTILLFTGWQVSNIGDIGHTPGTLATLEKYVPEANIICWMRAMNPSIEQMIKSRFPSVRFVQGNIIEYEKPENKALKAAFDTCDLFIWNSGMHLNFGVFGKDWATPTWSLYPLNYAYSKGIPYVLYGHSFDKFDDNIHIAYRPTLDNAAMVLCRDKESKKFLEDLGFKPKVLDFVPDAVFGLDVQNKSLAGAYLKANGLKPQNFLSVIIRTNTPKINAQSKQGDMLNPATISGELMAENIHWMSKTRDIITWWVRNTKMKVLLAPEMDKEIKYAKEWVLDSLPPDVQKMVVWRNTFWNVDEANAIYANAHTVFGIEPHSLIMALTSGVPVVHARPQKHGRKGYMFRDIGLGEWLFDIDNDSSKVIIEALKFIVNDYSTARQKVSKSMNFVQIQQKEKMMNIRKIIKLNE